MVTKRPSRLDLTSQLVLCRLRQQVVDNQLARYRRVAVADADRSEQNRVLRSLRDEPTDSRPKQHHRGEAALILDAHERTAQLDRRVQGVQQTRSVLEQRMGVKATLAMRRKDFIDESKAIAAD